MPGIVSYGAYVPYWRLSRSAIATMVGSGGRGSDEDSTPPSVEAARIALRAAPPSELD